MESWRSSPDKSDRVDYRRDLNFLMASRAKSSWDFLEIFVGSSEASASLYSSSVFDFIFLPSSFIRRRKDISLISLPILGATGRLSPMALVIDLLDACQNKKRFRLFLQ